VLKQVLPLAIPSLYSARLWSARSEEIEKGLSSSGGSGGGGGGSSSMLGDVLEVLGAGKRVSDE